MFLYQDKVIHHGLLLQHQAFTRDIYRKQIVCLNASLYQNQPNKMKLNCFTRFVLMFLMSSMRVIYKTVSRMFQSFVGFENVLQPFCYDEKSLISVQKQVVNSIFCNNCEYFGSCVCFVFLLIMAQYFCKPKIQRCR